MIKRFDYEQYRMDRLICETIHCDFEKCKYTSPGGCPKIQEAKAMCDLMCNTVEDDNSGRTE